MSDVEEITGTIDLAGLLPVSGDKFVHHPKRSCRECDFSFMEGKDRVCRRLPPQVTFIAMPDQQVQQTAQGPRMMPVMALRNFSGFPIVQHDAWCGCFVPKVRQ